MPRKNLVERNASVLCPKSRRLEDHLGHITPRDDLLFVDPFTYNEYIGKERLLVAPETALDEWPTFGRVFASGPGRLVRDKKTKEWVRVPNHCTPGDFVFYVAFGVTPYTIEWEGEIYNFLVMRDDLVLGTITHQPWQDICDSIEDTV